MLPCNYFRPISSANAVAASSAIVCVFLLAATAVSLGGTRLNICDAVATVVAYTTSSPIMYVPVGVSLGMKNSFLNDFYPFTAVVPIMMCCAVVCSVSCVSQD